ncbi:MAG TPA: lytic transglycosylase domain-containing protein [Pseudolabrys sp.]|jgi:hypothetical protein
MRQLFVPACVCLLTTWSGATGSDPRLSLDEFTGAKLEGKIHARRAPIDTSDAGSAEVVRADIPIDVSAADIASETPNTESSAAATSIAEAPADAPASATMPERIPLPPIAKPVVHRTREEVCGTLVEAAEANNLPVPFFISLLFQESRFKPETVSSAGAQGVAQFMPETAASVGLENPFDPLQAIPASARLLRNLVSQFGNLGLAAAAYNAGPKRIQDWLGKKGKLPEETKGYVKTITGRPAEKWTAAALLPGQRLPRHAPCQESAGLYAWTGPETIPLPARSPLRPAPEPTTVVAKNNQKTPSEHRIASIEKNAAAKTTEVAKADIAKIDMAKAETAKPITVASADNAAPAASAAVPVKISRHGARVTAVIDVTKPSAKIIGGKSSISKIMTVAAPEKTAKADKNKPLNIKIADTAKPAASAKHDVQEAAKPPVHQLAARKQHKPDKSKLDKVAQQ